MAQNRSKLWYYAFDLLLGLVIVAGSIYAFIGPLSTSSYASGGSDYQFILTMVGGWDLFEDGTLIDEGTVADFGSYPTYAIYILIGAIVMNYIVGIFLLFFLGRIMQKYNKAPQLRVTSIIFILVNLVGIVGTILLTTYTPTLEADYGPTKYGGGFIVTLIYFGVLIVLAMVTTIKPTIFAPEEATIEMMR